MGNGDDAIDLVRTQDEQAIRRARSWDEGIESDHDHGPLIDGMESVMNVSGITMKRMQEHGERLDKMATKADIEKMVAGLSGRNGGSVRSKKINVLGLFSFAGYTMHDIIRFMILIAMMVALYMIFDVKNHLSHMGEDLKPKEILTTENDQ